MHDDACFVQRRFDWFLRLEDFRQFFQCAAPRLDEEEVNEDEFEHVPEYEEEVVLCCGLLVRCRDKCEGKRG